MAPVPVPAPFNPIAPIQNNWDKISPWNSGYLAILGGIGTIFGFATAISLIVDHKGQPPKWPFTRERWNPKPTIDGDKKEEVTEEQIEEDEMAEVVGALGKRSFYDDELEWYDDDLFADAVSHLSKREDQGETVKEEGQEFADRAKQGAENALEEGKTGLDKIGQEFGEIVETAEEVGKEIWDEIKGVFDGKKDGESPAASGNETNPDGNSTTPGDSARARRVRFIM